jgi:hypothetical protein
MHVCRYCQNAMKTYADKTSADAPEASPSSPSVRFTAFDDDVRITNAHTAKNPPRCSPVERMNESWVDVPVSGE